MNIARWKIAPARQIRVGYVPSWQLRARKMFARLLRPEEMRVVHPAWSGRGLLQNPARTAAVWERGLAQPRSLSGHPPKGCKHSACSPSPVAVVKPVAV